MHSLTLTIGHNIGTVPVWEFERIVAAAADLLALEGLTAYPVRGYWHGVPEDSTRIEVYADSEEVSRILAATPCLAQALRQESIAVTVDGSPSFVNAPALSA